jgi:hypothetical protein
MPRAHSRSLRPRPGGRRGGRVSPVEVGRGNVSIMAHRNRSVITIEPSSAAVGLYHDDDGSIIGYSGARRARLVAPAEDGPGEAGRGDGRDLRRAERVMHVQHRARREPLERDGALRDARLSSRLLGGQHHVVVPQDALRKRHGDVGLPRTPGGRKAPGCPHCRGRRGRSGTKRRWRREPGRLVGGESKSQTSQRSPALRTKRGALCGSPRPSEACGGGGGVRGAPFQANATRRRSAIAAAAAQSRLRLHNCTGIKSRSSSICCCRAKAHSECRVSAQRACCVAGQGGRAGRRRRARLRPGRS